MLEGKSPIKEITCLNPRSLHVFPSTKSKNSTLQFNNKTPPIHGSKSYDFYTKMLVRSLRETQRFRLNFDDKNSALFLTSGVDSRLVYAISKEFDSAIKPITITDYGRDSIDLELSKEVAEFYDDKLMILTRSNDFYYKTLMNSSQFTQGMHNWSRLTRTGLSSINK